MELKKLADSKLKKHVGAIHVTGRLSLLQRKLSNVLLVNAYDNLLRQDEHSVRLSELAEVSGFDSNDQDILKKALKRLAETVIEWNVLDEDGREEWGVCSILSRAIIKGGRCRYAYDSELRKKLYNPEIYATLNLEIQKNFVKGHSLTLYENCARFKKVGTTGWIALETFKKLMGVEDSTQYKVFKSLNQKVIKPAVKEINNLSDLTVGVEYQKEKRRVVAVRFSVIDRVQKILPLEMSGGIYNQKLLNRLQIDFGFAEKQAKEALVNHDDEYIIQILEHVENEIRKDRVRNIPAFTKKALEKDFRPVKTRFDKEQEEAQKKRQKMAKEEAVRQAQEEQESDLKRSFDCEARKAALEVYRNLPEHGQQEIFKTILLQTTSFIEKEQIEKNKEQAFGFQNRLRGLMDGKLPIELQTFDVWKKIRGHK